MRHPNLWLLVTLVASQPVNAVAAEYIVRQVQVDPTWDNSHAMFTNDDPRLLGRVFDIRPNSVSSDVNGDICRRSAPATMTTLDAWLTRLFPPLGQAASGHGATPRQPREFGLNELASLAVSATRYRCDDSGPVMRAPQSISLPGKRLALAWTEDSVLLLLSPMNAVDRPHPSFLCANAANDTEKAVCSSVSLANWDRSISRAYDKVRATAEYVVEGKPQGDAARLAAEQRAWLSKRDSCHADAACLLAAYQQRMDELMLDETNRGNVATKADASTVDKDTQWYLQHRHDQ